MPPQGRGRGAREPGVEGLLACGEPDRAGDHVEALVVPPVAVLGRAGGVRGQDDLAQAEDAIASAVRTAATLTRAAFAG